MIIKYRFSKNYIDRLLKSQWWNLDISVIKKEIHLWETELNDTSIKRLEELCK